MLSKNREPEQTQMCQLKIAQHTSVLEFDS